MKKSESTPRVRELEKEIERLNKKVSKLESKNEETKTRLNAKLKATRKELKKIDAPSITLTKEQLSLLLKLFPDIDSLS